MNSCAVMKLFLLLLLSVIIPIDGLKILAVLPVGTKSHWVIGHEIIKPLVDAGHHATVLTPFMLKSPIANYEEIDISEPLKPLMKGSCHS